MTTEIIAIVSLVFVATSIAALVYEQRMDVLSGWYIERSDRHGHLLNDPLRSLPAMVDHLRWKTRSMIYLTCLISC
jgi:hypothetical protein